MMFSYLIPMKKGIYGSFLQILSLIMVADLYTKCLCKFVEIDHNES